MHMENDDNETLYIPAGLKTKTEIFEGFGKEELAKATFSTLVLGGIDLLIYLIKHWTGFCMIFILTSIAASIMMFIKNESNISVVDQIQFMIQFSKSQKVYKYRYLDEWKGTE